MKNPALLNNKLFDIEEKAFILLEKLSALHEIKNNTAYVKVRDFREFRLSILKKKEDEIISNLEKLKDERNKIIKQLIELKSEEEIENV